jgi:hypothetical protein
MPSRMPAPSDKYSASPRCPFSGPCWREDSVVTLVIDESTRQVQEFTCDCCETQARRTWAFINDGGTPVAAYFASCYHHNDVHEVWIDAILGTWGVDDFTDHLTFGCRVGPVQNSPDPAATLVNGGEVAPDKPIYGQKLTREAALQHPALPTFWHLVDHVLTHDPLINQHLYAPRP